MLTQGDILGPDPSEAAKESSAWMELEKLIELDDIKKRVESMLHMMERNHQREIHDKTRWRMPPNSCSWDEWRSCMGGFSLKLGLLSRGSVVVKTPADFLADILESPKHKRNQSSTHP